MDGETDQVGGIFGGIDLTKIDAPWTVPEYIYVSCAAVLALMCLAEVIAFTGALSYSYIKVHLKATTFGVRWLSLSIMVIWWALRICFLGAMLSLVPVPHWIPPKIIPHAMMIASQYTAFFLVGLLMVLPTLISVQQMITSPSDKSVAEQLQAVRTTAKFPRVVIVMPVYNEEPPILHVAICSAVDGDYPKEHLHVFISFDNDEISELYRALIKNLGVPECDYYPPVIDLYFRGVQITVSRFPHGGKRLTQKKTFGLINSVYKEYPEKTDHLFVLFIDSDILLHKSSLVNFVWDMQMKPDSKKDMLGMTGVITVTTKENVSFLNLMQDIEYVHGQFLGRAVESALGGVICLPGALTMFRYSAFLKSSDEYFAEREVSDLWDFGRSHLGEDRYLTHLLMTKAVRSKMIQFCHRASCKTEPVAELRNLMKQRRRWFLGFMTNESAFLSDPALWRQYPVLLLFRMISNIVTGTSMVGYIVLVAIITQVQKWSWFWLGLFMAYFFSNWFLMMSYGVWLGRKKALLYPLMFIVGPFVTWFLLVYGVCTANERTWGGPRADASADKAKEAENDKLETIEDGEIMIEMNGGHHRRKDSEDSGDGFGGHPGLRERAESMDETAGWRQRTAAWDMPPPPSPGALSRLPGSALDEDLDANQIRLDDGDLSAAAGVGGANIQETIEVIPRASGSNSRRRHPDSYGSDDVIFSGNPVNHTSAANGNEGEYDDEWDDDSDSETDGDETNDDDYSVHPLGFRSTPHLPQDAQWWNDDVHLSNFGIVPFNQRQIIPPELLASSETLVLAPMIGAGQGWRDSFGSSSIPPSPMMNGSASPSQSPFFMNPSVAGSSSVVYSLNQPSPAFRYVTPNLLTPANSTPNTPRMSPMATPSIKSAKRVSSRSMLSNPASPHVASAIPMATPPLTPAIAGMNPANSMNGLLALQHLNRSQGSGSGSGIHHNTQAIPPIPQVPQQHLHQSQSTLSPLLAGASRGGAASTSSNSSSNSNSSHSHGSTAATSLYSSATTRAPSPANRSNTSPMSSPTRPALTSSSTSPAAVPTLASTHSSSSSNAAPIPSSLLAVVAAHHQQLQKQKHHQPRHQKSAPEGLVSISGKQEQYVPPPPVPAATNLVQQQQQSLQPPPGKTEFELPSRGSSLNLTRSQTAGEIKYQPQQQQRSQYSRSHTDLHSPASASGVPSAVPTAPPVPFLTRPQMAATHNSQQQLHPHHHHHQHHQGGEKPQLNTNQNRKSIIQPTSGPEPQPQPSSHSRGHYQPHQQHQYQQQPQQQQQQPVAVMNEGYAGGKMSFDEGMSMGIVASTTTPVRTEKSRKRETKVDIIPLGDLVRIA